MDVQNPEQEIELPYDYRMLPLRALRMTARKKLAGFLDLEGTVVLINEGAMDEADVRNDSPTTKRVVILMSKQFLRSAVCDFQVRFAHALAPGARSRKLIPLIRERGTVIPRILRFLAVCDFTKQDMLDWVWDRLYAAIIAPIGKQTYFEPDDEENPFREESLKEITFPTFSPLDGPANSGNTDRKQSYLSEHSTPSMKAKSAASTPVMQPHALNNLDIGESYSVSPSFRQNNFNSAQTAIISKTDNTNAHNVTQNSYPSNSSNASAKNKKHKKVHPVSPLPRTSREPIEHPHHSGAKSDSHVISSTNPTASFGTRQRSNYRREVDETSYQSSRNNSQTISSTDGYFEIQL
ncbi:MYD88-like protein [Mya arenaria]|uniref:MYD88-like protein n=1 Tax=Mya arenaria TaxID=6604 RepID=A0ABY7E4T6_MYAAR|nr:MYD88-like protein [Mya arenaria]